MKLYILLDDESPLEVADKLMTALDAWIAEADIEAQAVDFREGEIEDWRLGVEFEIKRRAELKQPLDVLYKLAKKMEREFVIGIYDVETGERGDVCYFGYEEGCPQVGEIALYLGLNR